MKFNSILIGSEDPGRLAKYYTKLFGEPAVSDGTYNGWKIGDGFVAVGPHDQVKGRNAQPGRIIWNIESANVKRDFAKLEAAGAKVVREPYSLGDPPTWIATFADPDDNYFQLMTAMQASAQGDLLGIPASGRQVRWDAVDVYRVADGKIAEEQAADDLLAFVYGVGAYTPPWLSQKSQRSQIIRGTTGGAPEAELKRLIVSVRNER